MDLRGNIQGITFSELGEPLLTLKLDRTARTNDVLKYDKKQALNIKLTKAGNSRTKRQNDLMWAILTDIDIGLNKYPTEHGRTDIYTTGIEALGVEYKDIPVAREAIPALKNQYRACREIGYCGEFEGKEMYWVRCFIGSSKFNKKQMGELIDWFIRYAAKMQIPIKDYMNEWIDLFEEKKKKTR